MVTQRDGAFEKDPLNATSFERIFRAQTLRHVANLLRNCCDETNTLILLPWNNQEE